MPREESPVEAALRQGLALHRQGRLDEARAQYELALRSRPRQFDALHLLGLIEFQRGDLERALDLFDQAVLIDARSGIAHHCRGNALLELRRPQAALDSYDSALALAPCYADAYFNRGNALLDLGRIEAAIASFDQAIDCQAGHAPALNIRGLALAALGQHGAAVASYDRAIALDPGDAELHNNRGSALAATRQYDGALASFDRAIAIRPEYAEAHCNRANVLAALERRPAALEGYALALALKPEFAEALLNSGNVHRDMQNWQAALADFDRALSIRADFAEAHCNRGLVLQRISRFDEALASFDRAIELQPEFARAHVNRAMVSLLQGDFARGWQHYEWRWRLEDSTFVQQRRTYAQPRWQGTESLQGKTLLVHWEQGLGDTLQFCRYASCAADLGATVILEVQPPLASLLAAQEGVAQVITAGDPLPEFDYCIPLMSMPLAMGSSLSAVPAKVPYVKSNADKVRWWKTKLGDRPRVGDKVKRRVGLVWSGGVRHGQAEPWWVDGRRNIPLASLAALRSVDIDFYSLQKGPAAEAEMRELVADGWGGPEIADFTGYIHDFSDTAAFMEHLDLIITVDTATAHLAGALGRPVWILNRFDGCWRWLLNRADSPWYPTARIYKQQVAGDWDSVVRKVTRDLKSPTFPNI